MADIINDRKQLKNITNRWLILLHVLVIIAELFCRNIIVIGQSQMSLQMILYHLVKVQLKHNIVISRFC